MFTQNVDDFYEQRLTISWLIDVNNTIVSTLFYNFE